MDEKTHTENEPKAEDFDLKGFLESLTQRPGVYRMIDCKGDVIYVGKAKNLKKRVSSYFQGKEVSPKQSAMVSRIHSLDVRITHSEAEALLLECQLIKKFRPRYNITLRDDKSYPAIYISTHEEFPRVSFHRGTRQKKGRYFGPFPSASAVRQSLKLLPKIFPVRQCRDSYFKNRSRPCLEYQIHRCTAPCVGYINETQYHQDVEDTLMFLEGRGSRLIDILALRMEAASDQQDYERAARIRDQIATLRPILERHAVQGEQGDIDIIAIALRGRVACLHVAFIREGQLIGDHNYFPVIGSDDSVEEIMTSFMGQFYLDRTPPREILVNSELIKQPILEEMLTNNSGHSVRIVRNSRGERARRLQLAVSNAENALETRLTRDEDIAKRFEALSVLLGMCSPPRRIECFDISHTQGAGTVASCVVFDQSGAVKSSYRKFNISEITPGDDYAAINQAVGRRFQRLLAEGIDPPDILLIDGGKGQAKSAQDALITHGIFNTLILGISKGPDRKPGQEIIHAALTGHSFMLPSHSPELLLLQQIRDEAHRFAVTGHRIRRTRSMKESSLESIPGLGPKRRKELLRQFGGIREVERASIDSLKRVAGISHQLAQRIHDYFHDQD